MFYVLYEYDKYFYNCMQLQMSQDELSSSCNYMIKY